MKRYWVKLTLRPKEHTLIFRRLLRIVLVDNAEHKGYPLLGDILARYRHVYKMAAGMARLGQQGAQPVLADHTVWQVFATAGFAGGLMYWLIAGRNA